MRRNPELIIWWKHTLCWRGGGVAKITVFQASPACVPGFRILDFVSPKLETQFFSDQIQLSSTCKSQNGTQPL